MCIYVCTIEYQILGQISPASSRFRVFNNKHVTQKDWLSSRLLFSWIHNPLMFIYSSLMVFCFMLDYCLSKVLYRVPFLSCDILPKMLRQFHFQFFSCVQGTVLMWLNPTYQLLMEYTRFSKSSKVFIVAKIQHQSWPFSLE